MSEVYTPNAANNPANITMPTDGDPRNVASVRVALEGIADKAAHAQRAADVNTVAYPLASRIVQRVQRGAPYSTSTAGVADWKPSPGSSSTFEQVTVAAASRLFVNLELPDGATFDNLIVFAKAAVGHAGTPGTVPHYQLQTQELIYATVISIADLDDDATPIDTSYEALHACYPFSSFSLVVDNSRFKYILQIDGEYGAGALAGYKFFGVRTVCTVTSQDPGGS